MTQRQYYLVEPTSFTGAATAFTYHSEEPLKPGDIVQITVGRRELNGVVQAEVAKPDFPTKAVTTKLEIPTIPPDLLDLAAWIANYYATSPASVWSTMLPTGLARNRRATKPSKPIAAEGLPKQPLTVQQSAALARIRTSTHSTHLLQGVTGSGKTRIYLELAAEALAAGRSVIVLVPEIILTPQVVGQFEAAFGQQVLASHSKLTEAQRHRIWNEAVAAGVAQQPRVIVGPRSCLFMPVHELGLIVVDECHETSYKQDRAPRYHATIVAARRAAQAGARLVLGSATPGLVELHLAQERRIEHILLTQRVNNIALPEATILDLRNKALFTLSKFITQPLIDAIAETKAAGRQTLLYLNRRGSASSQICGDCGQVTNCPNCQLPLTFHADLMRLVCHHCNFRRANPAVCPACNAANLRLLGGGTKRIEAEIARLFPDARLARLDRDSATISHIKTVFAGLRRGEIDIIIGTQMIAKGLDLPAVDTIGVVSADTMLHIPDFSAGERTYQLLSQVSGRAGRGDRPGRVFIQTYTPEHPVITAAAHGTFDAFATSELAERQLLQYPPYVYLLKLTVAGLTRDAASGQAASFAAKLQTMPGLKVIGPAPAFIETQNDHFHWIITVKSKNRRPLVEIARNLPSTAWTADLDPMNLL